MAASGAGATSATEHTGNLFTVTLSPDKTLGLPSGDVHIVISGWKWPTVEQNNSDFHVGLIVRCNGENPTPGAEKQPPDSAQLLPIAQPSAAVPRPRPFLADRSAFSSNLQTLPT